MRFSISSFIDGLRRSLEQLPAQSRTAFAVCCADGLFSEVGSYVTAKAGRDASAALQEALDYLWRCAADNAFNNEQIVRELEITCGQIGWQGKDVGDHEQTADFYAIQGISSLMNALSACKTGSALSAAMAAECVINKLDRELSEELNVRSNSSAVYSHPKMKAEIERIQKLLAFLQDHTGLRKEEKLLFQK